MDLGAIKRNIISIRARVDAKALLMVKSDAYGHGLTEVARATESLLDGFGVATLEEGEALRSAGIKKDVLVLACSARELERAYAAGLTIGLSCESQLIALEALISSGAIDRKGVKLHIKTDSGMHRLGFSYAETESALLKLSELGVQVGGIYSHLRSVNRAQIRAFDRAAELVKSYYPSAVRHLAASGSLTIPALQYDAVRIGISAYVGAMTVQSEVLAARRLMRGEHIGYGDFRLKAPACTAIIFGGYGDGVPRETPSAAYIRGKKCKTLGRVCMDMFAVDTGDFLPEVGEEVILLSADTAAEVASDRKTIEYAPMTCWHGRCERIYCDSDEKGSETACHEQGEAPVLGTEGVGERGDMRRA